MKDRITKGIICLFLLSGLAGFVAFLFFYDRAFPEASVDLALSREEAISRSREFLQAHGFSLEGYRSVAVFDEQRDVIDFVERKLGLDAANELFRNTLTVWRWKIRWFKELNETEYTVRFSPDGRLAGFLRVLPDSAPGARLSEEQARRAGEAFLSRDLGLDLSRYHYIERVTADHPARLDQELVWRYEDFTSIPGSEYRISLAFQGQTVGGYTQWLKIPQSWHISQQRTEYRRNLLAQFSYLPVMLLFLSVLVVFFWRSHAGGIKWRKALVLAGASAVVVLLAEANEFPLALLSYETTQTLSVFWLEQLSTLLLSPVLVFLLFVPLFGATDVSGRLYLPERPWSTGLLSKEYLFSADALRQVILGYGMAFAAIGYVTLFYVTGEGFLGVWSPVDVKFGSNFSTYFPSLSAIYTGFSAAFMEELIFRLFAVALLYRLTKRFWPAILIPALIWGFAHTTYPQEPIWIRGVELSVAGIVYGWVFLRYGLITTLVSHFLYNVFVGVVPQIRSGHILPVAGALFALLLPLIFAAAIHLFRRSGLGERFSEPWSRPGGAITKMAAGVEAGEPVFGKADGRRFTGRPVWAAVTGAVVFCASLLVPYPDLYGPPPPSRLTERQAKALCDRFRAELGFGDTGYRSFTEFYDRPGAIPDYAIDRLGIDGARRALRDVDQRRPQWITRWYKEKTIQKFQVAVDEDGRLTGFKRTLADTDGGGRLNEEEARTIASAFLERVGRLERADWEYVEVDKTERPNRTDYEFTYRDRRLKVKGLQRRLSVTVSGTRVTAYRPPWYVPPGEWLRARELRRQEARNTIREIASGFIVAGIMVFLIIRLVMLFKRRLANRRDVRSSWRWAVVLGAVTVVLGFLNVLPSFYDDYFYHTEQSLLIYALMTLLGVLMRVVWMSVGIFLLFLVAHVVLRAWMPEGGGLQWFLDEIGVSRWKSRETGKGAVIGLSLSFLGLGIERLSDCYKAAFSPDLLSQGPAVTSISTRQLSEVLSLSPLVPKTILACVGILLLVVVLRRFLTDGRRILPFAAVVSFFVADTESLSWGNLLADWSLNLAGFLVFYYTVTKLVGWNPMAYLVWIWADFNREAITSFVRFVLTPSPVFFWPSIGQIAVLAVPIAAVLIGQLAGRGRRPGPPEGSTAGP